MKLMICFFSLLFVLLVTAVVSAQTTTFDFNNDKVGEAPSGFSTALTGRGRPGRVAKAQAQAASEQIGLAHTAYLPRLDLLWQENRASVNNIFGELQARRVPVLRSRTPDAGQPACHEAD
jgi:hypothetical protein